MALVLGAWQAALLLVPMPLLVQLLITGWINKNSQGAQEPLGAKPITSAFLNLDISTGLKHVLAQQLTSEFLAGDPPQLWPCYKSTNTKWHVWI